MNIYLAHLVGDFIFQNDWMAKGKKTSSLICLVHIITYLIPFLFCGLKWWQIAAANSATGLVARRVQWFVSSFTEA